MLKYLRIALLSMGALFAFGVVAQPAPDEPADQADQADQPDPPSRVARLSFIRGAVSFVPAGENDWVEAQINRPLITGDKLWTDHDSRAELEIGSSAVRIDEQTSFDFLNLDDQTAQVELTQGALNLRVRRLYDNQVYEVDTPTLAFVINRVGEYRVSVAADGNATIVSVMQGGGDAYGEGGARFRIEEGQSVTFNDSSLRDYYTDSLPRPDAFDEFIAQRDSRWDRARSRQYVSEDVIGYQDLDDNGDWSDVPEYGHVWYPTTVEVGWTPYHYGHWGWVGAYGWTWIDDAPWGFAPFHYGRWAYIGNRWGWCPGPIAVRPYYAPALVAFIGGGVSVGIGVGGPVGWFPLGPRDVYFPGYHVSRNYFTRVNVSNTVVNNTVINNYYGNYSRGNVDFRSINYANRNISGAVIAVPATAFVAARPVHTAAIAVNRETFANARVSSFAAVAPTRASLIASPTGRAGAAPPAAVVNRHIVAASKPPPPVASFAARETLLQKNPGQPLSTRQLHSLPAVQNNGGAARNAAVAERANVKVVTNTGAPSRTPAAPLVSRGNANAGAGNDNRKGGGNAADARRGGPANNAAQQTVTGGNARATGNATDNNGRGQNKGQNEHLESSRFVHGNANAAGGNANAAGKAPTTNTGTPDRGRGNVNAERQGTNNAINGSNATSNGNNRNPRTLDRGRDVSGQGQVGQGQGQGQGRRPVTTDNSARQVTGNAANNNNANTASGNGNGRGNDNGPAYRQERAGRSTNNQNQSVSGGSNENSQGQGRGNARAQEYRQPPQQQQVQQQQQRVQPPAYQPPPQQQQQVQRVPQGQPQGQGQQQGQQHSQGQGQGNNRDRGGDKKHNKDDDKKNGGGGR